jgi:hypothetical protein
MSGFSQYSVPTSLDLEIKPIPLTTNSVLTSNTSFQAKPINYTPPQLDESTLSSIQQSLSSFLNRNVVSANNDELKGNLVSQQENQSYILPTSLPNEQYSASDNDKNSTALLIGIGVIGVTVITGLIIYIVKHKK